MSENISGIPKGLLVLAGAVTGGTLGLIVVAIIHLVRQLLRRRLEPARSGTLGATATGASSERRVRHRRSGQ